MSFSILLRLLTVPLLVISAASIQAEAPAPYSEESVAKGSQLYLHFCTECHGKDGRALMDVISDATDLTDPEAYYNGSTRADMYRSIADGAGVGMPPWKSQFKGEQDMWHLVNFIRSLWTAEQRAAL
ncbi:MAG: c-type cytochrome [Proteobacteria bacterium]|nr:c-type cytochrome [Pseudomonadota bacterium]